MAEKRRVVRNPRALRALAHPVRLELLERLSDGPLTATQAASLVGESQANCSFHLRQLAKYGFVELAGDGTGRARPWKLTSRGLSFDPAGASADERTALAAASAEVSELLLDRAVTAASTWLRSKEAEPEPWRSAGDVITGTGRLTVDQLAELIAGVQEAVVSALDRSDEAVDPPDARLVRVAFVAVPSG